MTLNVAPELGAFFDFSTRTKLRVTGADRLRFLNGQISNDLRKATADSAIHGCVLNAKGKIDADVFIVAEAESYLISAEAEARETLAARLDRYVIADDVHIDDVSDELALFHVVGPNLPAIAGTRAARANRFGLVGWDLWAERSAHAVVLQQLSSAVPFCDESCAEVFRIERGIPRWGHELTSEIIPTEANLEPETIDYAKGCYIGQEVISRIKMSGQTNKRLCGFEAAGDGELRAGMRLMTQDERKDVGWLTSVTRSDRLAGQIGLGFLKRGFQEPGNTLLADGTTAVTVTPLPFL